ncbi:nucleotidyltransferase domain-containing protein [bacterium]|nr:nucleotidyltransferase domain-containing protein [bacterium]
MVKQKKLMPEHLKQRINDALVGKHLQHVIVFGSYARGDYDQYSDLDIIIVCNTQLPFVERFREFHQLFELPMAVELLVYTPQEFERMVERENPFIMQVLEYGIDVLT